MIFLLMLDEGLATDPQGAAQRAVARLLEAGKRAGVETPLKLTAAFSDGEQLYAVRFSSAGSTPTLYAGTVNGGAGQCLVSEPLDGEEPNWTAVPEGSFVTVTRDSIAIRAFEPKTTPLALAG